MHKASSSSNGKTTWKIGELAKLTGLTVRALHHYEEIGLLKPSLRAENDYRLYTETDVRRLQQIVSLKQIGFSLEQIKETLEKKQLSPLKIIEMQIGTLQGMLKNQGELLDRLQGLARMFESRTDVAADDVLAAIEMMNAFEKYYTPEQWEKIQKRREVVGDDAIRSAEQEWPRLIAEAKSHMEKGTDPSDPAVQKIAKRWQALIDSFTGGDPTIAASLQKMYENEPAARTSAGIDQKLMEYVGKALRKL